MDIATLLFLNFTKNYGPEFLRNRKIFSEFDSEFKKYICDLEPYIEKQVSKMMWKCYKNGEKESYE